LKLSIIIISKDEPALAATLESLREHLSAPTLPWECEVLVVDASEGRLDAVRLRNPWARWIDFQRPPNVNISIPHQRNRGLAEATGEIIVFTDATCIPEPGWLERLVTPISDGREQVTNGPAWLGEHNFAVERGKPQPDYMKQAATINLALRRQVFDAVGVFDQRFAYGSDTDFTWRLVDAGIKIRWVPDAVVVHDWGNLRRNLKRSRQYGAARVRLYDKHRGRLSRVPVDDPIAVVYPLFLLTAPFMLRRWRLYPLLLLVPLYRNRRRPQPARIVTLHIAEGFGVLEELARLAYRRLLLRRWKLDTQAP
jgi:glycosyltransferase involved in cell wall biosynthesis